MAETSSLVVEFLNRWLVFGFSLLLRPFRGVDPIWPLLLLSFLTGLAMLWIFGRVSNQGRIRRVKKVIQGNLQGVRLFQHNVRVVLGLQARILRETLTYLKHSLLPMLVVIPPLLVIVIHLNLYFDRAPLPLGTSAIVKVKLASGWDLEQKMKLVASDGVTVETPTVRIVEKNEVSWRVRAERAGRHKLSIQVGEDTIEKELYAGETWGAVSPFRTRSLLHLIQFPGEAPIPLDSRVEAIGVSYPQLSLKILGWDLHWLVLFFLLSVASAFIFRGPLGVEI